MRNAAILIPVLIAVSGCRDGLSAMIPRGSPASGIANLSWMLFAGAAVVMLIVLVSTWVAMRGGHTLRSALAHPRAIIVGGIAFPAVILVALLVVNLTLMRSVARIPAQTDDALPVTVTGEQWWWRIAYKDANGGVIASANEIRIPVGRDTLFTLQSADVIHSFWVPSLAGKVDMIPGRDNRLRVRASHPGVYRGPCAEYCGGPHALMALNVIAMPSDEFDAWLVRERQHGADPQTDQERQGHDLFLSSGCGTCHTVRGTAAQGSLGPDLTKLGGRRTIAADTLALGHDNLIRFIVAGQTVKPGNKMPEFRIFSENQLQALASYLMSLK